MWAPAFMSISHCEVTFFIHSRDEHTYCRTTRGHGALGESALAFAFDWNRTYQQLPTLQIPSRGSWDDGNEVIAVALVRFVFLRSAR